MTQNVFQKLHQALPALLRLLLVVAFMTSGCSVLALLRSLPVRSDCVLHALFWPDGFMLTSTKLLQSTIDYMLFPNIVGVTTSSLPYLQDEKVEEKHLFGPSSRLSKSYHTARQKKLQQNCYW